VILLQRQLLGRSIEQVDDLGSQSRLAKESLNGPPLEPVLPTEFIHERAILRRA
jgi:hypothetical protein